MMFPQLLRSATGLPIGLQSVVINNLLMTCKDVSISPGIIVSAKVKFMTKTPKNRARVVHI
jgi:hypothetical protein